MKVSAVPPLRVHPNELVREKCVKIRELFKVAAAGRVLMPGWCSVC